MNIEKSLKKNYILNFIRVLMSLIFPIITFPYISRILMPSGIGKVYFATSVISYFLLISSLGIYTYGIREAAKLRNNKSELSKFVKELFIINLFFTVVAYILLFISLQLIPYFESYRSLLLLCSIVIMATTLGVDWLYSALEEYAYITVRSFIFQMASVILMFMFVKESNDYYNYACITVLASVGSNLLNLIHSQRYVNWFKKSDINLKKHMKPVMVIFALNLSVNIYTNLDSVMLGFLKGDAAVGLYTAAIKIIKMVGLLITSLGIVLLPRLSFYLSQNKQSEFDVLIKKSFNYVIMISIPTVLGLFILSPQIIEMFSGNTFSSAINPMRIMCIVIIFTSISNLTGMQILIPSNREQLLVKAVSISAIINLVLNLIFIPMFGVTGAAISTVAAELSATSIQIYFLRDYFRGKKLFEFFYQYLISGLCMTLVLLFLLDVIKGTAMQLIILIVAGVLTYAICCVQFNNPLAKELMRNILSLKHHK